MQDYLSDYASMIAKENAKADRALMLLEKKEGLLGLAWLGLQKAGSLLSGAWEGVKEWATNIYGSMKDIATTAYNTLFSNESKHFEINGIACPSETLTDTGIPGWALSFGIGFRINLGSNNNQLTKEEGILLATQAALNEFDKQNAIETATKEVIAKLEKEGYFKDTSNVKGGVVVEYNKDGSVKRVVETSVDGSQKTAYTWNGPITSMERYNIIDGQSIKSYSETECMGTKIVSLYDSTGQNVYRQATYLLNENTNRYELQFVDQWLVDSTGKVIPDYKQYQEPTASIMMNPNYANKTNKTGFMAMLAGILDRTNANDENNFFRKSGCLLTAMAEIFSFYGDSKFDIPKKIDAYVDENNLWIPGTAMIDAKTVVKSIKDYDLQTEDKINLFNNRIIDNLNQNIPTIARYSIGHFVLVAGARYDANGNITDYLVRDPGTGKPAGTYLSAQTLYNYHWKSTIDKLYWIERNQRR